MRVTAETKLATEKAIRSAARKLFIRKGLEATSTRQIAAAARIAVGTLFNYFPSKEGLALDLAAEGFAAGRVEARRRIEEASARHATLEEGLFTLAACDIRALEPIRGFIGEVLDTGLSAFGSDSHGAGPSIRAQRLEDAERVLALHGFADAATGPVMHLYWALYLGVLSFWAADTSPRQEDSWALLDRTVRMFAGALRPAAPQPSEAPRPRAPAPSIIAADASAAEDQP